MDAASSESPQTIRKRRISRKERKHLKKKRCPTKGTTKPAVSELVTQPTSRQTKTNPGVPQTLITQGADTSYLNSYVPVSFPNNKASASTSTVQKQLKSVGRWFPSAIKLKRDCPCSNEDNRKSSIMLFYQYVEPTMSNEQLDYWRACLLAIAEQRENFAGRIRIAPEGVNCTVSAIDTKSTTAAATLRHVVMDLKRLDSIFTATDFKFFDSLSSDRHFSQFTLSEYIFKTLFFGSFSHTT